MDVNVEEVNAFNKARMGTGTMINTDTSSIDYPADSHSCSTCIVPYHFDLPQAKDAIDADISLSGIWSHSSDERYFIAAIDRQTKLGKGLFIKWLEENHIGYKPLLGKYDGVTEYSFIINARDWKQVLHSGFINRQNQVLYLWSNAYGYGKYGSDNRKATMYDMHTGIGTDIGVMVAINKTDLIDYDNWSYDINSDQYYTIKVFDKATGKEIK